MKLSTLGDFTNRAFVLFILSLVLIGLIGWVAHAQAMTPPPRPTDDKEIEKHCAAVTFREFEISSVYLGHKEANPQLLAVYQDRGERAKEFLQFQGMFGSAKEYVLEEKETRAAALAFKITEQGDARDTYRLTKYSSDKPDENEELLWMRTEWCAAHFNVKL